MEKNIWNVLFRRCFGVYCLYKLEFLKLTIFNFLLDIGPQWASTFCRFWEVNHEEPPCHLSIGVVPLGPWKNFSGTHRGVQLCSSGRSFHLHCHVWAPRCYQFRNCFAKVIYLSQVYNPNFSFWRKVIWKVSISNLEFKATICGLFIRYGSVTPLYLRMARGFARQAPGRVTEQIPGGLGYWASDSAGPLLWTGDFIPPNGVTFGLTIPFVGFTRLFPRGKSMKIIISSSNSTFKSFIPFVISKRKIIIVSYMISFKIRILKAAAMPIGIISSSWGESRGGSGWSPWALQIACFVVSWAAKRWRKLVLNDLIYFIVFLLWFLIIFLTNVFATAVALLISFLEFFGISIITITVVVMIIIVLLCFIAISWCNQNC